MPTCTSPTMEWLKLVGKGLFSGAVIVAASELAKKSSAFGALVVSLPLTSIMAMSVLYQDTKDTARVADFAEGILWLVFPRGKSGQRHRGPPLPRSGTDHPLVLFVILPQMLRRGYEFEVAMAVGILGTIVAYGIGIWAAQSFGDIS